MKQNSSERLLEWSEKIKNQKLSRLSEKAWCKEQGISHNTFQYWKKRVYPRNQTQSKKKQFIEIPEDRPWIEMSLQGVKLILYKDFDRTGLMSLISLMSQSC